MITPSNSFMELKISIQKPDWDPHPEKSTTNNHEWRKCVIVEFPNCDFKWIPTYKQIEDITKELILCEELNKVLCKENVNKSV